MKKVILSLLVVMSSVSALAMTSSKARRESWFLTDKMAYELSLSQNQMEDVYEINYDYFRSLRSLTSNYSMESQRRLNDLSYVLTSWQWNRFESIADFVNPVRVMNHSWCFLIYNRYNKGLNYNNRPLGYSSYKGGHMNNDGYYQGRQSMHVQEVNSHFGITNRGYSIPSFGNGKTPQNVQPQNGQPKQNNQFGQPQQSTQQRPQNNQSQSGQPQQSTQQRPQNNQSQSGQPQQSTQQRPQSNQSQGSQPQQSTQQRQQNSQNQQMNSRSSNRQSQSRSNSNTTSSSRSGQARNR